METILIFNAFLFIFSSGASVFINSKLGINNIASLYFTQSLIIVLIYIFGILGYLEISAIFLILLSFFYFLFLCFKSNGRDMLHLYFKDNCIFYIVYFILSLFFIDQFVGHNDEFNFWASSVKEMLLTNKIADGDSIIYYRMYIPGLSIYHYINLYFFKIIDPLIYLSYLFINLSALNVIFITAKNHKIFHTIFFILIIYLSYKILGNGFKLLIADQFIFCSFFASLYLIMFYLKSSKLYLIIITAAAIILSKQPGVFIGFLLFTIAMVAKLKKDD